MTLIAEPTTFTAEQAERQLREWFAAGRPAGEIAFGKQDPTAVFLWVATVADVDAWAAAMGNQARLCIETYATGKQRVWGLPGWQLDVWTFTSGRPAPDLGDAS